MASDVEITLGLDDREYQQGIEGVESNTRRAARNSGDSLERNVGNRGSRAFRRLALAATAAAGAIAAGLFTRASIRAASEQETVTRRLESALIASGQEVDINRDKIERFASEIQRTTKLSNEAVEAQAAFAIGLGATGDQVTSLVGASVQLSSALGTSLNGATQRLARTLQGDLSARLAQVIPELRDFTQEQLKAGAAIDFVAQRFAGTAEREAQTYEGRITQLSESFADLQKTIGQFITQSPQVTGAIKALRQGIESLNEFLIENAEIFGSLVRDVLSGVVSALEITTVGIFKVINAFRTLQDFGRDLELTRTLQRLDREKRKIVESARLTNEERARELELIDQQIEIFTKQGQVEADEFARRTAALGELRDRVLGIGEAIRLSLNVAQSPEVQESFDFFNNQVDIMAMNTTKATESVSDDFERLVKTLDGIFISGISRSIQLIGASLVEGGNFFRGFLGIALDALGDLLIGFGTAAITTGKTAEAIRASIIGLFGGQAIVAGVAAIAAGGALKAFSSRLGGASGGSPSIQTDIDRQSTPPPTDTFQVEDSAEREIERDVKVVVEGNIFDLDETGDRIVDVLNKKFEVNNASFIGARFS